MTNGKEYENRLNVAMDAANETQKEYLLVDYSFYDPSKEFNVLKVDTIAAEPKVGVVDFSNRTKIAKHHPATAAFTVTYFIPNDSMVIAPAFVQTSIPVATTLDAQYALITGAPSETGVSDITTAVGLVKTAIGNFAADGTSLVAGQNLQKVNLMQVVIIMQVVQRPVKILQMMLLQKSKLFLLM